MDVTMPDGTIIKNVPEGTTKQDLLRKLQGAESPVVEPIPDPFMPAGAFEGPQDPGFVTPLVRGAAERFTENIANAPRALINPLVDALTPRPIPDNPTAADLIRAPLQAPVTAVSEGIRTLTGGAIDPTAAAERVRASGGAIPRVEGTDVFAGAQALGAGVAGRQPEPFADRFRQAQDIQESGSQFFGEQAPVATAIGEGLGDIATIAATRGLARGALPDLAKAAPVVAKQSQLVISRALKAFANSAKLTGKRAIETGAEGAFLASLRDSDVDLVAAQGAGAQVLGDLALGTFKSVRNRGGLLKALGYATVVSLAAQQFTPGGLDRILPTIEDRNKDIFMAILLSAVPAAATGGRVPKGYAGPAFAAVTDTLRRGALVSTLTSIARDPVRTGPVVQKFSEDPAFFGKKAERLLTRALNSDKIDIRNTVERLMKDREFRQKFDSLER